MIIVHLLRGLIGATAGAFAGYHAFGWILKQGFYAMVVPGALIGLGFGYASGARSKGLGAICAGLAVAFTLFVEWKFMRHGNIEAFLNNLQHLGGVTWLMILLGAWCAYSFGMGRPSRPPRRTLQD
jgi:hypothetical protein